MRIVIFACRFQGGAWKNWEHTCDDKEAAGVLDSSRARAIDRAFSRNINYADYLQGARYIFDVARGLPHAPVEGDTRVYGVSVNEMMVGHREELERYFVSR